MLVKGFCEIIITEDSQMGMPTNSKPATHVILDDVTPNYGTVASLHFSPEEAAAVAYHHSALDLVVELDPDLDNDVAVGDRIRRTGRRVVGRGRITG